jgi:hypothetical protein
MGIGDNGFEFKSKHVPRLSAREFLQEAKNKLLPKQTGLFKA